MRFEEVSNKAPIILKNGLEFIHQDWHFGPIDSEFG